MAIRLLAIDLDGTLLTKDRELHPENIVAVKSAMDAGIRVVLASGRVAASVRMFSNELGLDGAMICSNGSHVQGAGGVELLHIGLSPEAVSIALEYARESGVHTNAYTRNELYFLKNSEWGDKYLQRVKYLAPELATLDQVKQMTLLKLIMIDDPDAIKKHHEELAKRLDPSVAFLTESEPEYLEVLSPEANKGRGLAVLSQSLGIAQHETAAIGDYQNDLEMVQWAGIGAAMANAVPEVKAAADVQVPSNEEAGVARFIEQLLKLRAPLPFGALMGEGLG